MARIKYERRPPGVITDQWLEEIGACPRGRQFFLLVFPVGAPETHTEAFAAIDKALSDLDTGLYDRFNIIGFAGWLSPRVAGEIGGARIRNALFVLEMANHPSWRHVRTALRYLVKGYYNADRSHLRWGLKQRVELFEWLEQDLAERVAEGEDKWQATQDGLRDMWEEARQIKAVGRLRAIAAIAATYGIELPIEEIDAIYSTPHDQLPVSLRDHIDTLTQT